MPWSPASDVPSSQTRPTSRRAARLADSALIFVINVHGLSYVFHGIVGTIQGIAGRYETRPVPAAIPLSPFFFFRSFLCVVIAEVAGSKPLGRGTKRCAT
jgi:hypothetical protein